MSNKTELQSLNLDYSGLVDALKTKAGGVPTQSKTATPSSVAQIIMPDNGCLLSSVTVEGSDTLIPENIRSGVRIFGVDGAFEAGGGGVVKTGTLNISSSSAFSFTINAGFRPRYFAISASYPINKISNPRQALCLMYIDGITYALGVLGSNYHDVSSYLDVLVTDGGITITNNTPPIRGTGTYYYIIAE